MTLEERNALLDEAKILLLRGWCQGSFGKDECGLPVSGMEIRGNDHLAVCFCAYGAIIRATKNYNEEVIVGSPLTKVCKKFLYGGIAAYNDTPGRTKYEVAALFDHAKEMPL